MKNNKDITNEELEYLKSKGWTVEEVKFPSGTTSDTYCHPILAPFDRGGYGDPRNARKIQEEKDAYDAGKCYYYSIADNHGGYGYSVYERSPNGKRRLVFNHQNEKIVKEMATKLKELGKCEQVILDTSYVYHSALILDEKHGSHYYYVPNLPCLLKTCRSIVLDRVEEGYWYPTEADFSEIEKPSFSKDDVEKMKDGPVKRAAQEEWKNYEYSLRSQESEKEQLASIKFIQQNDNLDGGIKAYHLLKARNGGEYEGFRIEDMKYVK